jgi:hypothetical protein
LKNTICFPFNSQFNNQGMIMSTLSPASPVILPSHNSVQADPNAWSKSVIKISVPLCALYTLVRFFVVPKISWFRQPENPIVQSENPIVQSENPIVQSENPICHTAVYALYGFTVLPFAWLTVSSTIAFARRYFAGRDAKKNWSIQDRAKKNVTKGTRTGLSLASAAAAWSMLLAGTIMAGTILYVAQNGWSYLRHRRLADRATLEATRNAVLIHKSIPKIVGAAAFALLGYGGTRFLQSRC